jgi:hypothetical protein
MRMLCVALVFAVLPAACAGDPDIDVPGERGAGGQTAVTSGAGGAAGGGAGGAGGAGGCPAGQSECGGACVDVVADPQNCGRCGNVCGPGAICQAGACDCPNDPIVTLATGSVSAFSIEVDETHAYWTNRDVGTVMKVPKRCGAPTVLASGMAGPWDIALDATHVYWTNYDGGSVMKVTKDGGDPVVLASGQSLPLGIAVDVSNVYWATRSGDTIMKVPKSGGALTVLASARRPHRAPVPPGAGRGAGRGQEDRQPGAGDEIQARQALPIARASGAARGRRGRGGRARWWWW